MIVDIGRIEALNNFAPTCFFLWEQCYVQILSEQGQQNEEILPREVFCLQIYQA